VTTGTDDTDTPCADCGQLWSSHRRIVDGQFVEWECPT
jgi:hypothetical protein